MKNCKLRVRHSVQMERILQVNEVISKDTKLKKKIEETPFKIFLELSNMKISNNLLLSLLNVWDKTVCGFRSTDGNIVSFKLQTVEEILGFPSKGFKIRVFDDQGNNNDLGTSKLHHFLDDNSISSTEVIYAMLIRRNCNLSVSDKTRLYIAFLFSSYLFQIPSKGVYSHLFSLLDKLEILSVFRWGEAIYDFLVCGLSKAANTLKNRTARTEIRIQGCVPILQIWVMLCIGMQNEGPITLIWPEKEMLRQREVAEIFERLINAPAPPSDVTDVTDVPKLDEWLVQHLSYKLTGEEHQMIVDRIKCEFNGELLPKRGISIAVVDSYVDILRTHMRNCYFFGACTYSRIIYPTGSIGQSDILQGYDKIFLPVLHDGHWFLLVVDCRQRSQFWLDSLEGHSTYKTLAANLAQWVNSEIVLQKLGEKEEWQLEYLNNIPKHDNLACRYDCAVYMIAFMVSLSVGNEIPAFDKDQTWTMRERIFLEIDRETLLPLYPLIDYKFLYESTSLKLKDLKRKYQEICADYEAVKDSGSNPQKCVASITEGQEEQLNAMDVDGYGGAEDDEGRKCSAHGQVKMRDSDPPLLMERAPTIKKLLILDVNGLLADIVPVKQVPRAYKGTCINSKIAYKWVFKRPFCADFLQFCFERFVVGVWSSRTKEKLNPILSYVMPGYMKKLLFIWGQEECTNTGHKTRENCENVVFLKELQKVWKKFVDYDESNTLLLDDSPCKALRNPPNTAIFPETYHYEDENDDLLGCDGSLRVYLEGLAAAENVQKHVEQYQHGQNPITEVHPITEVI